VSGQPLLKLTNIHKRFGQHIVHDGISFELNKGETLALLGKSGTGKSVLLRMIIGLENPDKGEIFFQDKVISTLDECQYTQVRMDIAYAFQGGALFDSLTVFENLAYPLREHTKMKFSEISEKVNQVLTLVELQGIQNLMPSDLSGGMKKRVGLARAIIMNPQIILYDEPTAGLDPQNRKNVLQIVKKLKLQGLASIYVTHDIPAAIELADRIMVFNNGSVIFNDNSFNFINSTSSIINEFIENEGYGHD